jgi:serine/threonine protein kinase
MAGSVTYRFVRCLGRGGFGEVYLAHRRTPDGLERRVAVKVLRSDLPDPALAMARLTDEARLLTILNHPSIVAALELTRLRDRVALVTEYIDGIDLSRFCTARDQLPPRVVVSAMAEVASALDCAFNTPSPETGKPLALVHRDVKPENIRISRHGSVKLLDFGIARSNEVVRRAQTSTGNLPFTPGYTAPESFVALRQEPATDVFALGATVYRLLAGQRFYEGVRLTDQAALSAAPDLFRKYLEDRLSALPPLQPSLVPLLRACLAYDPAERPIASVLRSRSEALSEVLAGPTPKRWARSAVLPEERSHRDAELLGLELTAEPGIVTLEEPRARPAPAVSPDAATVARRSSPRPPPERPPPERRELRDRAGPSPTARPFPWLAMGLGLAGLLGSGALLAVAAFAMGLWFGR